MIWMKREPHQEDLRSQRKPLPFPPGQAYGTWRVTAPWQVQSSPGSFWNFTGFDPVKLLPSKHKLDRPECLDRDVLETHMWIQRLSKQTSACRVPKSGELKTSNGKRRAYNSCNRVVKENYLLFILPLVQLSANAATRDNPTSTELDMYWHVYIYHYLSCVLNNTDPQESAKLTNFPPTESKFPQLGGNPWGWVRRTPSCAAYDSPHLEGLIYILPKSIQNNPPHPSCARKRLIVFMFGLDLGPGFWRARI